MTDFRNKYSVLQDFFGHSQFRNGQEQIIDSILAGRDCLGVMPTGAGKSMCYQIPALMFDGITIVVSPLISLMKDQVNSLIQSGVRAAYLNSSLTAAQYEMAISNAARGMYKIIYVAPERLMTGSFLSLASSVKISMLAVDEAHCVSQWGQDFRPSYMKIPEFLGKLPYRPIVSAFTATATAEVKADIIKMLELRDPFTITTGFDRKNLYFGVSHPHDKYSEAVRIVEKYKDNCGIIYCSTRKNVESVCEKLCADGYNASRYHAGLSDEERRKNQDDFIFDRVQVMVATNAFGMGIDKSNVSYVIHYNMPKNLESYYQEVGRCARDGEPGECLLLYSGQDVITNQMFIENNRDNQELDELTRRIVMERDQERLKKMTYYCFTKECLRDYILRYFGEYGSNYCGNCSNCKTQFDTVDMTAEARILAMCVKESHQRYGINVILDTVHGANNAKIRQYGMGASPAYGVLSKTPSWKLRQIFNQLLAEGYLKTTPDSYMIVKLTEKSEALIAGQETFTMKMAKEPEKEAKTTPKKKVKKTAGLVLNKEQEESFEILRALRAEIAREEKVPPYIVFSDKTLVQMCIEKPTNKNAMLKVSGVGEFKFEKYGERFLEVIRSWT